MRKNILDRYTQKQEGEYLININAGKASDLYNDFDKQTPYVRKELDQDLEEYITYSAKDLFHEDFIIQFSLTEKPDEEMKDRITSSIRSYYLYLKTLEINELVTVMRKSLIFFILGVALLFLSVWTNEQLGPSATVITKVFAQGLTVAAWVSLWEALATFIINWTPYRRRIKLYNRIASAPIEFD